MSEKKKMGKPKTLIDCKKISVDVPREDLKKIPYPVGEFVRQAIKEKLEREQK